MPALAVLAEESGRHSPQTLMPLAGRPLVCIMRLSTCGHGTRGQLCTCVTPTEPPRDSIGALSKREAEDEFFSFGTSYLFSLYTHLVKAWLEGASSCHRALVGFGSDRVNGV